MTQAKYTNMTLNTREDLPEEFYVFVNLLNPITKHNFEITKGFSSAVLGEVLAQPILLKKYLNGTLNYLPFVPNSNIDSHSISMYTMSATGDYRAEYNCELYRSSHDNTKLYPSRLSCIYAFGDYESCKVVAEKYGGWDLDSVQKFRLVDISLTRVAKVNMEVISLIRSEGFTSFSPQEQEKIWGHYWSGRSNLKLEVSKNSDTTEVCHSGIIWEYLIEGRLESIEKSQ